MKTATLVLLFVTLVAVASDKPCISSSDCADDECCLMRRFSIFKKSECKKLAARDEPCSDKDETHSFLDDVYMKHCPCAAPLECIPEKEVTVGFGKIKYNPKCRDEAFTTSEPEEETTIPEVTNTDIQ